jgi:hypothetical protein
VAEGFVLDPQLARGGRDDRPGLARRVGGPTEDGVAARVADLFELAAIVAVVVAEEPFIGGGEKAP